MKQHAKHDEDHERLDYQLAGEDPEHHMTLSDVASKSPAQLTAKIDALKAESHRLKADLQEAELAKAQWYADEAAEKEMLKNHHMLRKKAVPLYPPEPQGRDGNGGSRIGNHKRLLQLLCSDAGLLYRDDHIEVHAAVHRPAALLGQEHFPMSPASPSSFHDDPAFGHSLWAEVTLVARARTLKRSPSPDGKQSFQAMFENLRIRVEEYDFLEVDLSMLPCGVPSPGAKSKDAPETETQTIRCELLDWMSAYPTASIEAQITTRQGTSSEWASLDVHRCSITLPLGITTFLRPMPLTPDEQQRQSDVFEALWTRAQTQTKPATLRIPSPMQEVHHEVFSHLTPWNVLTTTPVMLAAATCGGVFQYFELADGALGLGAELPAHGCIKECQSVLVRVAVTPNDNSGSDLKKASSPSGDGGKDEHAAWEVSAIALDEYFEAAALASVVTQLKCLPTDMNVQSPISPRVRGLQRHQQAGG